MIELKSNPGFRIKELTPAEIAKFVDLGVHTCAFMHGRPNMPVEKMHQYFAAFVRDYAFTSDSEIYFVEAPHGEYAAQIWLHSVRNVFNRRMELWIWDLTVSEPFRKRGIARDLLGFARDRAELKSCDELWLLVSSANDVAVRLYQSTGLNTGGYLMKQTIKRTVSENHLIRSIHNAVLRPLRPKDVHHLINLWQVAGLGFKPKGRDREDRLNDHLGRCEIGGWGLWYEEKLVAATIISNDGRKGWIERLATDPNYRRTGFAKAIISAAVDTLRQQGTLVIGALIEDKNVASRRLFESCGFSSEPNFLYYSARESKDS